MTKKQKEQKKKRLKSLIILLLLTIVMLSTSTYAWFTANKSVTIDPIDVYVAASSGLQISTNGSDWKTVISNNDIKNPSGYSGHKNMLSSTLVPVSTTGSVTGGYLNFYRGTVEGAASNGGAMSLTAVKTPTDGEAALTGTATSDFIAFDVFLKVDQNSDIYLDDGSGVSVTVASPANPDKGLQYATRYAFVIEGNGVASAGASAFQAYQSGSSAIIIEPNYDAHNANGVTNARDYYGITTTAATSGVAAVPYVGVKAAISTPIALTNTAPSTYSTSYSDYFGTVSTLYKTNVAYSNGAGSYDGNTGTDRLKVFTLSAGVTKVRVYMWIEGQDVDCENNASGAYLTYKIGLTLNANSTATP